MSSKSSPTPTQNKALIWVFAYTVDEPTEIRVLILKRPAKQGGYWQPVTGKVEEGETVPEGALREAREETGLLFPFPIVPLGFAFEYQSRWKNEAGVEPIIREQAFGLRVDLKPDGSLPVPTIDSVEHESYEWVSVAVAERKIRYDSNRRALEFLVKTVSHKSKSPTG